MGKRYKVLNEEHIEFIKQQYIFFVGTAGAVGTVNVSPKGMDTFRVINERKVVWLNLVFYIQETVDGKNLPKCLMNMLVQGSFSSWILNLSKLRVVLVFLSSNIKGIGMS